METSTPVISPNRKKHSLVQKLIPIDESLGDIESEIQTRRQEAINKSTESRRRLSAAPLLAGFTASQLTQHCKDVIKLSTENKINCKNAFNFWLIDVMAAMSKKKDSEINKNFQVASCTLDASVKIYGYRVDAIHTDAVKMAGGFFSSEAVNDEEKKGNEEGGSEENGGFKPRIKKKKKKLTVVPPETLNSKSVEVLLDLVPRQNSLTRKSDGNDLLVKVPKYNDGGLLLIDSDYPCWPYDNNIDFVPKFENKEIFDHTGLKSLFEEIKISKEEDLCPAYSNFEFGKSCDRNSDSEDELDATQNSERFEFDVNASVEDVAMDEYDSEPETLKNRIHIPAGGFESDEEIVIREGNHKKSSRNLAISDLKTRISVNPLEYSMFDEKILKAWAGPTHWKVKPIRKLPEENSNNEDISKPVASKRTRKGKIKSSAGLFDIFEEILVKNLAQSEKTTLFKSTMLNWNPMNTTMPEDRKRKARNLFSLYHIPSLMVSLKSEEGVGDSEEISDHQEEPEEEELEYCSTSVIDREEGNEARHTDEEQNIGGGFDAWDSANMVEAPNKIEPIPMSNFKRRKHVDIKYLKKGLWKILSERKKGTYEEKREEQERLGETVLEFRELVKLYFSKMPKNFGSSLSDSLVFNALLHLTNEKSLILKQEKNSRSNFLISQ